MKDKYIALMVDPENMPRGQHRPCAMLMVPDAEDANKTLGHELEVWKEPRETWSDFKEKWQKLGALLGLRVEVWRPEWWPP